MLSEGMSFVRHEMRQGVTVAVFRLHRPVLDVGPHGEERWIAERVLERPALQLRLRNLRAMGLAHEASADALANWPEGDLAA